MDTTSPAGGQTQGSEEGRPVGGQPPTDALIDIRDVKLTYETKDGRLPVLDGVDMQVPEGGFVAVVGPSGCGKSTLTRLIAGLLEPNAGEVWLHGERVTGPKSSVGMAFQNPVLLEWRSVLRNVTLPLELVAPRMPKREKEERALQLLTLVGLEGFERKRPSELSGGMRQRASLCRSIVHKPEVLILDEPFGALDAFTREDLWQTMQKVKSEEPFTGVMITHDLRESIFLGSGDRAVRPTGVHAIHDGGPVEGRTGSRPPLHRGGGRNAGGASGPDTDRAGQVPTRGGRMNWRLFAPVIAVVVFALLWEAVVWVNDWPNYKMASPSDLGPAFWKFRWLFLEYGWDTLWRTVAGLLLSVAVGVLLGMIMGLNRTMRDALYPLLVGFNAIPKATVVPIIALLFVGAHDMNTILIAFLISFFPIAVSVSIGLSTLEPEYRDILASLGASRFTIFWKIALPKTLPEFFGALKVAVTLAFIGTNLMEIVEPHGRGLGHLFDSGKISADYPLMFAVLIALAALGILLFYVVVVLERIFAGWAERSPT